MIWLSGLSGKYQKYNNNNGYVSFDDRNTPQAFSHFTYQYTEGAMMVVDIQVHFLLTWCSTQMPTCPVWKVVWGVHGVWTQRGRGSHARV